MALRPERAEAISFTAQEQRAANDKEKESASREGAPKLLTTGTVLAATLSAFWIGAAGAYIWGYFGPSVAAFGPHMVAFAALIIVLPPALFLAAAYATFQHSGIRSLEFT